MQEFGGRLEKELRNVEEAEKLVRKEQKRFEALVNIMPCLFKGKQQYSRCGNFSRVCNTCLKAYVDELLAREG
jgi:hypothetical protein